MATEAPSPPADAPTDRPLLRLEEALERMLAGIEPLAAQDVPLRSALGLVLAETLTSRVTLPPWDNSAMDGFAVRSRRRRGRHAGGAGPPARSSARSPPATSRPPTVGQGTAVRILTGGIMPRGADAVVPVEDTDVPAASPTLPTDGRGASARPRRARTSGAAGSDLRAGDVVLGRGTAS